MNRWKKPSPSSSVPMPRSWKKVGGVKAKSKYTQATPRLENCRSRGWIIILVCTATSVSVSVSATLRVSDHRPTDGLGVDPANQPQHLAGAKILNKVFSTHARAACLGTVYTQRKSEQHYPTTTNSMFFFFLSKTPFHRSFFRFHGFHMIYKHIFSWREFLVLFTLWRPRS